MLGSTAVRTSYFGVTQRKETLTGFDDDVLWVGLLGFWAFFLICCFKQIPEFVDMDLSSV